MQALRQVSRNYPYATGWGRLVDVDPWRRADGVWTELRRPDTNMPGSGMIPTKWTADNPTPWKDDPPWSGKAIFRRVRTYEDDTDILPYRALHESHFCVSHRCLDLREFEDGGNDPNSVFSKNAVHAWMFRGSCVRWAGRNGRPCDSDGKFVWMKLFGYRDQSFKIPGEVRMVIFKDEAGMKAAVGEALVHEVMES